MERHRQVETDRDGKTGTDMLRKTQTGRDRETDRDGTTRTDRHVETDTDG